jgi:AIPR protein
MSKISHIFRPAIARRIPDPVFKSQFNTERHLFVMNVKEVPLNLSTDPNARTANINKQVYKIVEDSLLDKQDGAAIQNSFHLKNKGITIVAESVEQSDDKTYQVTLGNGHGIIDGGHTYKLICDHIKEGDLPDNQYVNVEIRTGIQHEWIRDISGGLNTGIQVQLSSLLHLEGEFEEIKTELKKHGFDKEIAWQENDDGSINVKDLVSIMQLFDIDHFPNDSSTHPLTSYTSKESVLKKFKDHAKTYFRMKGILKDILVLHDSISSSSGKLWNEKGGKKGGNFGSAGKLVWMEYRAPEKKAFIFPFSNTTSQHRLMNSALYPILSSFRWYVAINETDKITLEWKVPFEELIETWNDIGIELLRSTAEMCDDLGKNPNALGKSKALWGSLHNMVKAHELQRQRN